ncbi:uncharacterized protein ACNS7B_003185 [Menidia menidia]
MSSTSVTTVGGVVIVTQVIPKEDASIPMQAPPPEQKAPPPLPQAPPTKAEKRAAIFLRVEPQGLGVVQIFIGLLCVLWSLSAAVSPFLLSSAPFALGGFFVLSGSLAVASARHTSIRLVWASLGAQVLGGLGGVAGLAYLGLLLTSDPAEDFCQESCAQRLWTLTVVQIFIGLLCVLWSLSAAVSPFLLSSAPFALGGFFVLSGSLAVASARHTSIRLVWASLGAQVWGGLGGVAGLAYLGLLLTSDPAEDFCQESCAQRLWTLTVVLRGLAGLLCVLLVLQVCVCVGVATTAVQTIRRIQHYQEIEVSEDGRSLLSSGEESGKA